MTRDVQNADCGYAHYVHNSRVMAVDCNRMCGKVGDGLSNLACARRRQP